LDTPTFLIPENQLESGYKDCVLCFVDRKGEEKRCHNCSGLKDAREKFLWEINRERIKRRSMALSLFFPGVGHIYSGRVFAGLFWMSLIPLTMGLVINTWQGPTVGHVLLACMFALLWYFVYLDAGKGYSVKTAVCETACPAGLHVPDYIALVREGSPETSLALIHERLPFASVCGRICHHPCEEVCVRNEVGDPIAIAAIKRYAADRGYAAGVFPRRTVKSGRIPRVAIIGGGATGLSAANTLAILGARVVLYDAKVRPGGIMYSCIPSFRLPVEELNRDIDFILRRGVEFRGGVTVGGDTEFEGIVTGGEYDAVLVATGAPQALTLRHAGTESQGFYNSLAFLERVKLGKETDVGKRVVVVGGGNVATDAARSALRLGAEDVSLVCIEKKDEMTAFPWEVEEALREGVRLIDGTAVKKFFIVRQRVAGFEAMRVSELLFDNRGRVTPLTEPGSAFEVKCDTVIIGIGSRADLSFIPGEYALKIMDDQHKTARLIFKDKRYTIPIYISGDCLKGPSTIIEASASGRKMAMNIYQDICVKEVKKVRLRDGYRRRNEQQVEDSAELRKKIAMEKLSPEQAVSSFEETGWGYTGDEALSECERCARCNLSL
jgi:NADPH-dependent glutamate synthase beta subunit-like oxidoreductase